MRRAVKKEPGLGGAAAAATPSKSVDEASCRRVNAQCTVERRVIRSRYLAVKNLIVDEKEDLSNANSDKFKSIISEVENIHQSVQKPREQVADAETLLDIANTLVTSVKSQNKDGITPSDFTTAVLRKFGVQEGSADSLSANVVSWKDVGGFVSNMFLMFPGCCTMIGPMKSELKKRKAVVHRKHKKATVASRPEELDDSNQEEKSDTDKNMSTMFNILRKNRTVALENLVLNRASFAQTVENIFALSFLVKDGRAEISVEDNGCHVVSPKNAPSASAIASGEVTFNHFVFRFDFKDWKLMLNVVRPGEELMPHRCATSNAGSSRAEKHVDSQSTAPSTPIRKLSRNRGLVVQEESVVDDTPEKNSIPSNPPKRRTVMGNQS